MFLMFISGEMIFQFISIVLSLNFILLGIIVNRYKNIALTKQKRAKPAG